MDDDKPNLGLASTEELFRELIARFTLYSTNGDVFQYAFTQRACVLSEMLGSLNAPDKEYKTVNGG